MLFAMVSVHDTGRKMPRAENRYLPPAIRRQVPRHIFDFRRNLPKHSAFFVLFLLGFPITPHTGTEIAFVPGV
jgi:hypothetical protein